jgi:hypothetical protein
MKIKYPRTPHFQFSPRATKDDRILESIDSFHNKGVIITEKNGWRKFNTAQRLLSRQKY